jgi:heme oxygenase
MLRAARLQMMGRAYSGQAGADDEHVEVIHCTLGGDGLNPIQRIISLVDFGDRQSYRAPARRTAVKATAPWPIMSAMRLTQRLREATAPLHRAAERAGIMRALLGGDVERDVYCSLLRNLYPIYATLERALERHRTHPHVAPVYLPMLYRCSRIAADLDSLFGTHWRQALRVDAAADRYVDRLGELANHAPALIVSHAYVRYLGDLSGGQLLRGLVKTAFELTDGRGTAYYDFGAASEVDALKARYRAGLDRINFDAATQARVVSEAQRAFALHTELFEALAISVEP